MKKEQKERKGGRDDDNNINMDLARKHSVDDIATNRELGRKTGFTAGFLRGKAGTERKPNGKKVKLPKPERQTIRAAELAALKAECDERLQKEDLDHGLIARVQTGMAKSKNHNMRRRLHLKKERMQREAERARIEKM
ncbi:hypothetical protein BDV96DRAFT_637714 [Lophiotrema nucula]|uniref:Uncharacterized protein n=1 Tax=Lophiotrema nucula TaxID=690887 RepID=A0A6A5YJ74_9PLEO|nr:hypothetical protein BDV96DRAFT_637714 [Lophiotrema nucula]